jgi:hypothetical protein
MSTTDDDDSIAWTLVAIGGGAILLWLFLRGRTGTGGTGPGSGDKDGGPGSDSDGVPARRVVFVRVLPGDRIELDDASVDLDTAVASARAAGIAQLRSSGAAREGWVSKVLYALLDAGVHVDADWDILLNTPRFDSNGRAIGGINKQFIDPVAAQGAARSILDSLRRDRR